MPPKKIKQAEESSSNSSSNMSSVSSSSSSSASTATTTSQKPSTTTSSSNSIVLKPSAGDSDRLQFAVAINNLTAKSEALVAALQEIQTFDREKIQSIEMKLEAKKKEYADMTQTLTAQYEQAQKDLENELIDTKIKQSQEIRQHGLTAANNLLQTMGMTSISGEKLNAMISELASIKEISSSALTKAVQDAQNQADARLERELSAIQLQHKAAIASLEAQVQQQVKEIRVLNDTISGLKHELSEQRQLTKEVAQASSKSQISQNFGNK